MITNDDKKYSILFVVFVALLVLSFITMPGIRDNGAGIEPTEERILSATESIRQAREDNYTAESRVRNAEKRAENIETLVGESENITRNLRESIGRCQQIIGDIQKRAEKEAEPSA